MALQVTMVVRPREEAKALQGRRYRPGRGNRWELHCRLGTRCLQPRKGRKLPGTSRTGCWARHTRNQWVPGVRPLRRLHRASTGGRTGSSCIASLPSGGCCCWPVAHERRHHHLIEAFSGLRHAALAGVTPAPPWGIHGKGVAASMEQRAGPFRSLYRVNSSGDSIKASA